MGVMGCCCCCCVSVGAFSPNSIRINHKLPTRRQRQQRRDLRRSSATTDAASTLLSPRYPPSSLLEEKTVSLEWVEYFAPSEQQATAQRNKPVLFLHGLLGSKRNFASCATMLAAQLDKQRRILGVDLRNHGESSWADAMDYPSMAMDVKRFCDAQGIDSVILVGHSMGGKVAQALALMHPDLVEGLVVLDIAPVTYNREQDPHWRAVEDILRAIHKVVMETDELQSADKITKRDLDVSFRQSIPDPSLRAFVLTNFDDRNNQWKIPIATIVQGLEQIAGFDLSSSSATTRDINDVARNNTSLSSSSPSAALTYDGDVFIINGGQSRFVRHAYMDQIASYFPNHMLTTIEDSGHWVHAEAPNDLVALLKRYLDR